MAFQISVFLLDFHPTPESRDLSVTIYHTSAANGPEKRGVREFGNFMAPLDVVTRIPPHSSSAECDAAKGDLKPGTDAGLPRVPGTFPHPHDPF